jgi:hypothetical protein
LHKFLIKVKNAQIYEGNFENYFCFYYCCRFIWMQLTERSGIFSRAFGGGRQRSKSIPDESTSKPAIPTAATNLESATPMKIKIYLLIVLLGLCAPIFANQYDDDERAKRYFDNLDKQEQDNRDAAKQRADDEDAKNVDTSGGGAVVFLVMAGVAIGAWLHFKK